MQKNFLNFFARKTLRNIFEFWTIWNFMFLQIANWCFPVDLCAETWNIYVIWPPDHDGVVRLYHGLSKKIINFFQNWKNFDKFFFRAKFVSRQISIKITPFDSSRRADQEYALNNSFQAILNECMVGHLTMVFHDFLFLTDYFSMACCLFSVDIIMLFV